MKFRYKLLTGILLVFLLLGVCVWWNEAFSNECDCGQESEARMIYIGGKWRVIPRGLLPE